MNYGLYLSASGVLTNSYRQDVYANNLANVETVGFKPDIPSIRQRSAESIEDPATGAAFRNALLDKLGGGALAGPQRIDFTPAPVKRGGPLDLALRGENAFFAVQDADAKGVEGIKLTRDGRLGRDAEGYLITAASGRRILDTADRPIQVGSTYPIDINSTGEVRQNNEVVAQIQVAGVDDLAHLHKEGDNLFGWDGRGDARAKASDATIRPGFVETSGVDPIHALMQMVNATKDATMGGNLIRYQDEMMDRAVNSLGRVA
jgi:flagellar basal body rod protein FlgG